MRCFSPRRSPVWPWWLGLLGGFALATAGRAQTPAAAPGQDRVILRSNETQVGRVVGVTNGQVQLQLAAGGSIGYPLGVVARVEAPAPAGFVAGIAAYEAGDWDRALAALRPVAERFRGLPAEWARQANAMLGDIYLEKKDLARAEAAYAEYRKFYGASAGGSLRMSVGQARLLLAKKDVAGAQKLLEPLAASALKDPVRVSRADAGAYGQTFLLLGQLREAAGDFPAALESYLRASVLFAADRTVAATAQKSADALRAAHPGLISP